MAETNIDWKEKAAQYSGMVARNSDRMDSLEAENERLRAALEPFTFRMSQRIGDDHLEGDYQINVRVRMAEVRAARRVLSISGTGESDA